MSFLQELRQKRVECVAKLGLNVGDFVQFMGNLAWYKICTVWQDSFAAYKDDGRGGYSLFGNVSKIHRANDPWDYLEVRFVTDETGVYGGKHNPPVPVEYRYQGPLELSVCAWKLRQYAYSTKLKPTFRNPVRNQQFELLRIQDLPNKVALTEEAAERLKKELEAIKNADGWSPCIEFKPLEVYNKTISIKELL